MSHVPTRRRRQQECFPGESRQRRPGAQLAERIAAEPPSPALLSSTQAVSNTAQTPENLEPADFSADSPPPARPRSVEGEPGNKGAGGVSGVHMRVPPSLQALNVVLGTGF